MPNQESGSSDSNHTATDRELICPVCSGELSTDNQRAVCAKGHAFDRAREGYLNLLLANQKGSNDPGDDRESIQSRHAFLEAGNYAFLADAIQEMLPRSDHPTMLDAGCGEGYFLRNLSVRHGYGVDISRSAIRLASKTSKSNTWIVANVARQIPMADDSCNVLLSVVAPRNASEFSRVLRSDGLLVAVVPGSGHLQQLTSLLMERDAGQSAKPGVLIQSLAPQFRSSNVHAVSKEFSAGKETIGQLIAMTPLRWKSRKESLVDIVSLSSLKITASFQVHTFTPR